MCPTVREEDVGKTVENENGAVIGTVVAIDDDTLYVESGGGVLDSIRSRLRRGRATEDVVTVSADAVDSVTETGIQLGPTTPDRTEPDDHSADGPNRKRIADDPADVTPGVGLDRHNVAERDPSVDTGASESDVDESEERREQNVPEDGQGVSTPDGDVEASGNRRMGDRPDERDVPAGRIDEIDGPDPTGRIERTDEFDSIARPGMVDEPDPFDTSDEAGESDDTTEASEADDTTEVSESDELDDSEVVDESDARERPRETTVSEPSDASSITEDVEIPEEGFEGPDTSDTGPSEAYDLAEMLGGDRVVGSTEEPVADDVAPTREEIEAGEQFDDVDHADRFERAEPDEERTDTDAVSADSENERVPTDSADDHSDGSPLDAFKRPTDDAPASFETADRSGPTDRLESSDSHGSADPTATDDPFDRESETDLHPDVHAGSALAPVSDAEMAVRRTLPDVEFDDHRSRPGELTEPQAVRDDDASPATMRHQFRTDQRDGPDRTAPDEAETQPSTVGVDRDERPARADVDRRTAAETSDSDSSPAPLRVTTRQGQQLFERGLAVQLAVNRLVLGTVEAQATLQHRQLELAQTVTRVLLEGVSTPMGSAVSDERRASLDDTVSEFETAREQLFDAIDRGRAEGETAIDDHLAEYVDALEAGTDLLVEMHDLVDEPHGGRGATGLERLDGLDAMYRERLEAAGIESVAELARADPETVADAASVTEKRAAGWIDQADA